MAGGITSPIDPGVGGITSPMPSVVQQHGQAGGMIPTPTGGGSPQPASRPLPIQSAPPVGMPLGMPAGVSGGMSPDARFAGAPVNGRPAGGGMSPARDAWSQMQARAVPQKPITNNPVPKPMTQRPPQPMKSGLPYGG